MAKTLDEKQEKRINLKMGEAVRLMDKNIEDTKETMQKLNKQLEEQIRAKQELLSALDVMDG